MFFETNQPAMASRWLAQFYALQSITLFSIVEIKFTFILLYGVYSENDGKMYLANKRTK